MSTFNASICIISKGILGTLLNLVSIELLSTSAELVRKAILSLEDEVGK